MQYHVYEEILNRRNESTKVGGNGLTLFSDETRKEGLNAVTHLPALTKKEKPICSNKTLTNSQNK